MTDHELLELGAKAAGIEVMAVVAEGIPHRFGGGYWNPLTDDGDALRLAVKLGMDLRIVLQKNFDLVVKDQTHVGIDRPQWAVREPHDGDPAAATRRAIVRAAAIIGEEMP